MKIRPTLLLIALAALPTEAAFAGPAQQVAIELNVGTSPVDVAVLPGDRIVASLLGVDTTTVSWYDSASFGAGPFTVAVEGESAQAIEGGTLDGSPVLFVGGAALNVVRFDTSQAPVSSASVDTTIGLVTNSALLTDLAWVPAYNAVFALDGDQIRCVDFNGAEPAVDAPSGIPFDLGFTPTGLARLDDTRLVVVGEDDGDPVVRRIDISDLSNPIMEGSEALTAGFGGLPLAVTSDGSGTAFVLVDDSAVWSFAPDAELGDDDDSAVGDDDDSGADDDDSGADDDDSGADDDDSGADDDDAGDDDDSGADDDDSASAGADAGEFFPTLLGSGPGNPADISWASDGKTSLVYALGGNSVAAFDADGADLGTLSITGAGTAIASGSDGYSYAVQSGTGQMAVLTAGPWLRRVGDDAVSLISNTDTVDITLEATLGVEGDASCAYSATVGGDIDGSGTAVPSVTGTANDGETFTITLLGSELLDGNNRVHVFCEDAEGDVGRTSFAYYKGGLDAPGDFTVTAGEGQVVVSWTDLDSSEVDKYILYFDQSSFAVDITPETCTEDAVTCSPLDIPRTTTTTEGDDDDSAGDDDDSSPSGSSGTLTYTLTRLTNSVTWYFAMAAADANGNVGPRTAVLSATPSVLGGAAALAGDEGCSCSSSVVPAAAPLLFLLPLAARRRRSHR